MRKHLDGFVKEFPTIQLITEPVQVDRTAFNLLRSYVKGAPLNVLRTSSNELKRKVASIIDDFEIVMLDHYEVGQFLPEDFDGVTIYHGHNAYFKIWQTYSKTTPNPFYKLAARLESGRVRKAESLVAKRADLVFAAPDDLVALESAGVCRTSMCETYHLGDYGAGNLRPSWYQSDTSLVYVGFLGWEANVKGLLWFIRNVWPRLARKHPLLKFKIIGKNADERLQAAVLRHENIELLGFVESLDEVFANSLVCVAPLTFGSGMKVKVLSALARSIPVVTTPIGAESIAAIIVSI